MSENWIELVLRSIKKSFTSLDVSIELAIFSTTSGWLLGKGNSADNDFYRIILSRYNKKQLHVSISKLAKWLFTENLIQTHKDRGKSPDGLICIIGFCPPSDDVICKQSIIIWRFLSNSWSASLKWWSKRNSLVIQKKTNRLCTSLSTAVAPRKKKNKIEQNNSSSLT